MIQIYYNKIFMSSANSAHIRTGDYSLTVALMFTMPLV